MQRTSGYRRGTVLVVAVFAAAVSGLFVYAVDEPGGTRFGQSPAMSRARDEVTASSRGADSSPDDASDEVASETSEDAPDGTTSSNDPGTPTSRAESDEPRTDEAGLQGEIEIIGSSSILLRLGISRPRVPSVDPPVTTPPSTSPPATEPPVTEPPVTEPPVTEPPVTEPPVTEPPVTEPPVTEPPLLPPFDLPSLPDLPFL